MLDKANDAAPICSPTVQNRTAAWNEQALGFPHRGRDTQQRDVEGPMASFRAHLSPNEESTLWRIAANTAELADLREADIKRLTALGSVDSWDSHFERSMIQGCLWEAYFECHGSAGVER